MTPLEADRAAAQTLVPVSRETLARLDRFVALLLKWQRRINLVAPSTLDTVWTRHVADSLQLLAHAPAARTWVDLGSGAGFPGIVLACALAGEEGREVHLVESDSRKAAFLREAARVTAVPALVHCQRAERFAGHWHDPVDIVTARALSPLSHLLDYAEPFLQRGAQALFPKGQDIAAELTEAARYWHIDHELLPSVTHPEARIVRVLRAERRGKRAPAPSIR